MHLQRAPAQEYKLVRCLRGRVFDVAVDLRPGSASFGRWFALELSEDQPRALLIPPGVAHGFQALSDDVQLLYQHSAAHVDAQLDDGVHHADPLLGIRWPLPVRLLSPRDARCCRSWSGHAAACVAMKCRHCRTPLHPRDDLFIDLGSAPPSNAFLKPDALDRAEIYLPLKVLACPECGLVQVDELQRHEALFSDDYVYFSSFSASWLAPCAATMWRRSVEAAGRSIARSLVMEVASNDGYLLQYLRSATSPASASSRPRARRVSRAPRASRASASSSAWRSRAASSRSAAAATWCWATTCWPMCPTSTTSSPGCARCWRRWAR